MNDNLWGPGESRLGGNKGEDQGRGIEPYSKTSTINREWMMEAGKQEFADENKGQTTAN